MKHTESTLKTAITKGKNYIEDKGFLQEMC